MRRLLRAELRVAAETHPNLANYIASQRFSWGFATRDVLEALLSELDRHEFSNLADRVRANPGLLRSLLQAQASKATNDPGDAAGPESLDGAPDGQGQPQQGASETQQQEGGGSVHTLARDGGADLEVPAATQPKVDPATLDAWRKVFPG